MKKQSYAKPELTKNGNIRKITFWNSSLSYSPVCGDRETSYDGHHHHGDHGSWGR